MPILERLFGGLEKRGISSSDPRLVELFGGSPTATGKRVSPTTAAQVIAVQACRRVIGWAIGSLPLKIYNRSDNSEARDHPLWPILTERPNPEMSSMTWREAEATHVEGWGNSYGEIVRTARGRVAEIWPLLPDRTRARRDTESPERALFYETTVGGQTYRLPSENVLHFKGLGYDGIHGLSPVQLAREGISIAMAAEEFAGRYYGNGMRPSGVIEHPNTLSPEAQDNLRRSFEGQYTGLTNALRVLVLEEGTRFNQLQISAEEAQFLESRQFQVVEIARMHLVPPHMIMDLERATFSNIEHQSTSWVQNGLTPRLVKREQEMNYKLLTPAERLQYYISFNVDGLLRGDTATRHEAYATGRQWGYFSVNDVRGLENLPPIEGGDVYLSPINMVPADQLDTFALRMLLAQGQTHRLLEPMPEPKAPALLPGKRVDVRAEPARVAAGRRNVQQAYQGLLVRPYRQITRRETDALRAAIDRNTDGDVLRVAGFEAWTEEFYPTQAAYVERQAGPFYDEEARQIASLAAEEIGAEDVWTAHLAEQTRAFTEVAGQMWVGSSTGQLNKIIRETEAELVVEALHQRAEEWDKTRAGKLALRESVTLAGIIAMETWWERGILRQSWVAFGESCPFCTQMNGREVAIRAPFLPAGTTMDPEGANAPLTHSHDIKHPQLHAGCDCSMIARVT